MRHTCGLLIVMHFVTATAGSEQTTNAPAEEVVVADEIRANLYEPATNELTASMSHATGAWCAGDERARFSQESKPNTIPVGWLCSSGRQMYFRGIYPGGAKSTQGVVCERQWAASRQRIRVALVDKAISSGTCVPFSDFEGAYDLYLDPVNQNGAA